MNIGTRFMNYCCMALIIMSIDFISLSLLHFFTYDLVVIICDSISALDKDFIIATHIEYLSISLSHSVFKVSHFVSSEKSRSKRDR